MSRLTERSAWRAATAYFAIAIVMTWPLAVHLTTRLPADLGDPAFNSWVMMWTGGQLLSALSGHLGALANYWNGNIFGRPIVNGYSGFWPPRYFRRANLYMRATEDPPEVWSMLADDGVTHVLVHEDAFAGTRGEALSGWLRSMGARAIDVDGRAVLFDVAAARTGR